MVFEEKCGQGSIPCSPTKNALKTRFGGFSRFLSWEQGIERRSVVSLFHNETNSEPGSRVLSINIYEINILLRLNSLGNCLIVTDSQLIIQPELIL